MSDFDVVALRRDFPGLHQDVHGKTLCYLDNAATTQKPRAVLDATEHYYVEDCANVHRGVHLLSERATRSFEAVRGKVARFIGAKSADEVVFTKGVTDAVNLVAQTFGRATLTPGQHIILSGMEHHSNIVPWQLLAKERGLVIDVIPVTDAGELDLEAYAKLLGPKTGLVASVWISNALGTVNPVARMVELAKAHDVPVLLDAAQALPHVPVDVDALGCDFLVGSGHKCYGPTGVGFLWGKKKRLEAMPPYQGGGDMIATVSFEGSTFREPPARFEAGTPNIAGVIGFGAALDYLSRIDLAAARAHEDSVTRYAVERLSATPGVRLVGTARERAGAVSFVLDGVHPHDVGTILDREGVAIRTGHHCTQPLMARFAVPATARASFGLYNTKAEVDALVAGLAKVKELMT
jgi:cysteine desulfurase/selenocysteine lyase